MVIKQESPGKMEGKDGYGDDKKGKGFKNINK